MRSSQGEPEEALSMFQEVAVSRDSHCGDEEKGASGGFQEATDGRS